MLLESLDPPSTFSAVVGSWCWLVGGDGGPARLGTLGGESSADWLPGPERRRPSLSVAAPLSDATTACTRLAIRMAEEVSEEAEEGSEEAEEGSEEDGEEEESGELVPVVGSARPLAGASESTSFADEGRATPSTNASAGSGISSGHLTPALTRATTDATCSRRPMGPACSRCAWIAGGVPHKVPP